MARRLPRCRDPLGQIEHDPISVLHRFTQLVGRQGVCLADIGADVGRELRGVRALRTARADVLYRFWKPRTQASVDLVLYIIFFLPAVAAFIYAGWNYAAMSIRFRE